MKKSPIQLTEDQRREAFVNGLQELEEKYGITIGIESKFKLKPKEEEKK